MESDKICGKISLLIVLGFHGENKASQITRQSLYYLFFNIMELT